MIVVMATRPTKSLSLISTLDAPAAIAQQEAPAPPTLPALPAAAAELLSLTTKPAMRARLEAMTSAHHEAEAKAAQDAASLVVETGAAVDQARLVLQEAERAMLRAASSDNRAALVAAREALEMHEERHALARREAVATKQAHDAAVQAHMAKTATDVLNEAGAAASVDITEKTTENVRAVVLEAMRTIAAAIAPLAAIEQQRRERVHAMLALADAAGLPVATLPAFRGLLNHYREVNCVEPQSLAHPHLAAVRQVLRQEGVDADALAPWVSFDSIPPWF